MVYQFGVNSYSSTLKPWIIKRELYVPTVSKPDQQSEPHFKELEILKLTDLVIVHKCTFYVSLLQ